MKEDFRLRRVTGYLPVIFVILFSCLMPFLSWQQDVQLFLTGLLLFLIMKKPIRFQAPALVLFFGIFLFSFFSDAAAYSYLKNARYEKAIAANPRNPLYRVMLAEYYFRQGNYRSAVTQYLISERKSSDNIAAKIGLAFASLHLGDLGAAWDTFRKIKNLARHVGLTYDVKCRLLELHKQILYNEYLENGYMDEAMVIKNNLLPNGDFSLSLVDNDIPLGWVKNGSRLKVSLSGIPDGNAVLSLSDWQSNDTVESFPIELEESVSYRVVFLLRIKTENPRFYVQWNVLDENQAIIKYTNAASFLSFFPEWRRVEFTISPAALPKNARYINLVFKWYGDECPGCPPVELKSVSVEKAGNA